MDTHTIKWQRITRGGRLRPGAVDYGTRQRGAAALIATLILVVIASLSALVVNKAALTELKLTGVDIRSKEVYAAAIGGLEYGAKQLQDIYFDADGNGEIDVTWSATDADGYGAANATLTNAPAFANADTTTSIAAGADSYSPVVSYTLITAESEKPAVIELTSTVTAVGDTHVTKTVSVRLIVSEFGTPTLVDGPPLIVEECMSDVTGTPDIFMSDPGEVAVGTVNGDSNGDSCIDAGHFTFDPGGQIGEPEAEPGALFESLFGGIGEEGLQQMAAIDPEHVIFVDNSYLGSAEQAANYPGWTGNTWHDDAGSGATTADGKHVDQVILYFAEDVGCPQFNGGPVVYGLVYYAADDCDSPGAGNGTIYGTLAYEGDVLQLNANLDIYDVKLDSFGSGTESKRFVTFLPGSWKDF